MVNDSMLEDQLGLVFEPDELMVLVELGGGDPAGDGRAEAIERLRLAGLVTVETNGTVVADLAIAVLAEALARPSAVLDLRVVGGGQRRRSTYFMTADGSARVVRAEDDAIVTPVVTTEVLVHVASELALDLTSPRRRSDRLRVPGEALKAVLDGDPSAAAGVLDDEDARAIAALEYAANAGTGAAELNWIRDDRGMLWAIRPVATEEGHVEELTPMSGTELLMALGSIITRAGHDLAPVVPLVEGLTHEELETRARLVHEEDAP